MSWIETLAAQRILLTGPNGFLGSNVRQRLLSAGLSIDCIARRLPATVEPNCRWHEADLADAQAARAVIERVRPDLVLHLAGYAEGLRGLEHVLPSFYGDLATTVHVLTAAAECNARVVLAGSLEEPLGAAHEAVPSSPYAASKWAASAYARMFGELYHTPVVQTRIFMTYGPGQRRRKIVPYVIDSLLADTPPQLASGRRPVDWIYVDDVTEGLLSAAASPAAVGRTLDLGSGELVTIRELVEMAVRLCGRTVEPQFGARPDPPREEIRQADLAATTAVLGWRPRITLEEGLRRTIAWHAEPRAADPNESNVA